MKNKTVLSITLGLFLLFLIYPFGISLLYGDLSERALFGDSYGTLNALFAGFAFLGVIYTIKLQIQELRLQREELKTTSAEVSRAAKAEEFSADALSKLATSLKITAKLNGLNSRLQYYNALIELNRTERDGIRDQSLHQGYINEVDAIIEEIKLLTADT